MIFPLPAGVARSFVGLLAVFGLISGFTLVSTAQRKTTLPAPVVTTLQWYRGNTHAHTNNSDGDSSPEAVAERYRSLGYNFVVITDHNKLTDVDTLNAQLGIAGTFLVIKGEEVTDSYSGKQVHLNALNNSSVVAPQHGSSVLNTIENNLTAIRQAGGLPYIAHPNYGFAISANDLINAAGALLFEVYNAHPVVNNNGDATHPSVEANWDTALSQGKLLYGIGADDEHTLTNPNGALPGQAWIMVRASSLDPSVITQAIASGDFYASTGVTLHDYHLSATGISIAVEDSGSATTVDFIGRNGQLLQRTTGNLASYQFTHHEQYVRAKLVNGNGQSAWTQPVYTERLDPISPILNGASMGKEPAAEKSVAPDSVASVFGIGLADSTLQASRDEDGGFPTTLAGTSITVNGRSAEIFYASSSQLNFHLPADTEAGLAQVVISKADGVQLHAQVNVANSAPGIFTEEGNGLGKAVVFDLDRLLGREVMHVDDNLRRFYVYATGVRGAAVVQATLNGHQVTVERIRACRGLPGLDQITIVFSDEATQAGANTLQFIVDGILSNSVRMTF
ncbi:MAG TPA: CehA/McbA family metallohydrolase [Pyrinomonadaceae bacterium]|jgi:uncharacterized protein (TIGR03437 family)|nr:CehA/McbA family metallohydrolase [Pyrinomonadaceae bacterium]